MNKDLSHPPVRALSRGLAVLFELNAAGPSTCMELARRIGLNRTTIYRLLNTLMEEGFVAYDGASGLFRLTPQARSLSDGLTLRDETCQAALPAMFGLLRDVNWPSDFGVFDAGAVVIRETTHPFSPFSIHRAMIGKRRALLKSALGRAILAAADANMRREMLEIAAASGDADAEMAADRSAVEQLVRQTKRDGYASSAGETDRNISAIALPVMGRTQVAGSLNIIFFSSSMTPPIAASRYLESLRHAVEAIEKQLSISSPGREPQPGSVRARAI